MFYSEIETDDYGYEKIKYFLTQGDSCQILATPQDELGNPVDPTVIQKVLFKLGDDNYKLVFSKEAVLQTVGEYEGKYLLTLTSEETQDFNTDSSYTYEFEYTFVDGKVETPNQSQWTFLPQIK